MPKFKIADLNQFLVCKLCDGYFREASTSTECLHTFCKACLEKEFSDQLLKSSSKSTLMYCPTCNENLGWNPFWRDEKGNKNPKVLYDRNLQACVDKIFPEFQQREEGIKNGTQSDVVSDHVSLPFRAKKAEGPSGSSADNEEGGESTSGSEDEDAAGAHGEGAVATKRSATAAFGVAGASNNPDNGGNSGDININETANKEAKAAGKSDGKGTAKQVFLSISLLSPADASKLPEGSALVKETGVQLKMPLRLPVRSLKDFLVKSKKYVSASSDLRMLDGSYARETDEQAPLEDNATIEQIAALHGYEGYGQGNVAVVRDTKEWLRMELKVLL